MKIQAHSTSEPQLKEQAPSRNENLNYISSYRDTTPESPRFNFLEKISRNNIALSDVEGNTSGPSNRGGIIYLILMRTIF